MRNLRTLTYSFFHPEGYIEPFLVIVDGIIHKTRSARQHEYRLMVVTELLWEFSKDLIKHYKKSSGLTLLCAVSPRAHTD